MSIKTLTKNSIDNTNIDGARANHFSAGMRSGIVKGAYNEGRFFASASNIIALDSCELRISGHQVIIDSIEAITLSDRPTTPTKYSMIAEIQVSDTSVPSFRLFIQPANVNLKKDNLFKTNNGSGTYQLRIGNFTLGTTGLISDVIRTADIITGGGEGGIADIKFNATATKLSSSSQPEVNADYNEETKEWDLSFGIPAGGGTDVTIGGIIQKEWSADFVESERQKSKNLLVYPYTGGSNTHGITFTDNGDGSIAINGKQNNTEANSYLYIEEMASFKLPAGIYTMKCFADTTFTSWTFTIFDGVNYYEVSGTNGERTFTLSQEKRCDVYVQVRGTSTDTFNNVVIKPMLVSGTDVGEWESYNGAIVHHGDAPIVFAEKERRKSKNLLYGTDFKNGYMSGSGFVSSQTCSMVANLIEVEPNTEYTYSVNTTMNYMSIATYDKNGTLIAMPHNIQGVSSITFTTGANVYFVTVTIEVAQGRSIPADAIMDYEPQIELGKVRTAYQKGYGGIVRKKDIKRTALTAYLISSFNPTANDTKYILPLTLYNSSNITGKLTLNNDGTVTIGANVKKIKVEATGAVYNNNATGNVFFFIEKNNDYQVSVRKQWGTALGYYHWGGITIPTTIIDVKEGDIIAMTHELRGVSTPTALSVAGSNDPVTVSMTVEVIE